MDTPMPETPVIRVFCYPSPFGDDVCGMALDEDGFQLAGHISSNAGWSERDMITSGWKDAAYDERYPDGWNVEWLGFAEDPDTLLPAALLAKVQKIRGKAAS